MPRDSAHDATAEPTHVERKLPAEIPDDRLDPDAVKVVRRLRRAGFTAYLVGGCVRDLRQRLVHTIGDPDVRMREDPVRILRAIRFAAKCGLRIEPDTLAAMRTHVVEIPRCAPPRVLEEVLKLLRSGASRQCLELMRDVGALRVLLPPVAE